MLYLWIALAVYACTAVEVLRAGAPSSQREVLSVVLMCALIASAWPFAVGWRILLGPARVGN